MFRVECTDRVYTALIESGLAGQKHPFFVYTTEGKLNFGIINGKEQGYEDWQSPMHTYQTLWLGSTANIRDWIIFGPEDAQTLLRACLSQYTRDRLQVPEIVHLFTTTAA